MKTSPLKLLSVICMISILLTIAMRSVFADKVHDNSDEDSWRGLDAKQELEFDKEKDYLKWKKNHKREEALKKIRNERMKQSDYIIYGDGEHNRSKLKK